MRGRRALLAGTTITALACGAVPAAADHHEILIREVYPGTVAEPAEEFVEIQMYANGQENLNPAASIEIYGADGLSNAEFMPGLDATFGDSQRTFLFGNDPLGVVSDYGYTTNEMDPAGGAVCFDSTTFGRLDCVAWGSIANPPVSAGTPEPGAIPDGSSLERSIARGCPTLLEVGDDTDSSTADLAVAGQPTPRANSTVPTESACPNTTITKAPRKKTTKRRAKFEFTATLGVDEFQCKLDRAPFKDCDSPFKKRVKLGKHKFKVRAENDPSPASYSWKVKKRN
jgi:hypothetical protein